MDTMTMTNMNTTRKDEPRPPSADAIRAAMQTRRKDAIDNALRIGFEKGFTAGVKVGIRQGVLAALEAHGDPESKA